MNRRHCNFRILPSLLFLCVIASNSRVLTSGQLEDESLNFCDIPCVQKVYDFYCGGSRCTTGASDYGQIFALCTDSCAAAVAGEAMMSCLTTTVPDRDDWADVQGRVLEEIVSFCSGYEIAVDENVSPLKLRDTDKKLRKSLFDDPEDEEKQRDSKKGKKGKKSRKFKAAEEDEKEEDKAKDEPKRQKKASVESDKDTASKKGANADKPRKSKAKSEEKEKTRASPVSEENRTSPAIETSDETSISREIGQNIESLGSIGGPEKDEIEESFDDAFDADSSK